MPSMRPLDEKKFREEYDLDKDGRLNKVSIKRKIRKKNTHTYSSSNIYTED